MSGHKIFVSYKYADNQVENLANNSHSTVRDYVDDLESRFDKSSHIYKGESDGEDLSSLSEGQIWETIKDRIFDSTVTIVMISKGMRETVYREKDQWIPWEVSFSLRTQKRKREDGSTYTSFPNAMIGLVLPDESGSYEYYYEQRKCCETTCILNKTNTLFDILSSNMFNKKDAATSICRLGTINWPQDHSYIKTVKWIDFLKNINPQIEKANDRQERIDEYEIHVDL